MSEVIELTEVPPADQMKLLYPNRPWESEPDTAEWYDARTGYKCRIERQKSSGTLCGYVGVFKGHPVWGVNYNDADWENSISVHGGLTFSDTDDNGVHWFGFDTAHFGDFCPGVVMSMLKYAPDSDTKSRWMRGANGMFRDDDVYRTWEYVENEVRELVRALWALEKPQ